jgi:hypothetical protein
VTARADGPKVTALSPGSDTLQNPFPGPQAYGRDDQAFFFGREDEIEELTSLVLSSRATLLYAPSGAGKSSLLQAGLAPHLEEQFDFVVLPTVRLGMSARSVTSDDASNPFIRAVREALNGEVDDGQLPLNSIATAASTKRRGSSRRVLLILDQFEEVLNDPTLWRQRDEFFTALTHAVNNNPWLRAIIALRSDYLADLVPYERNLPGHLVVRYQLESLNEAQATEAISAAFAASGVALADEDLCTLLDRLLEDALGRPVRAQHVNAIQLQVVCRRLWEELRRRDGATPAPILTRDSAFSVRSSMVQFVDEAIAETVAHTHGDEALVRWWLRNELITSTGRRAFVLVEEEQTAGLPNAVVDALAQVRLLQFEQRHGSRLVELTHDSMVDAVRDSNEAWLQFKRRRRLRTSALLFALLIMLIAAFPLLVSHPDVPVQTTGHIERQEARIPFSGVAQGGAVIDLVIFAESPRVDVRVVEQPGDVQEKVLAKTTINAANTTSTLGVRTSPNVHYAVILNTLKSDETADYAVTVSPMPIVIATNDDMTGISSPRVGVLLKPGEQLISVENGSLYRVTGAEVLFKAGKGWAVVKRTPDSSIAVLNLVDNRTTTPRLSATVHRQVVPPSVAVAINHPVDVVVQRWEFRTFTLEDSTHPLGAEVSCGEKAILVSLVDTEATSTPPNPSGSSNLYGSGSVVPLNVKPGRHRLVLASADHARPFNCVLNVRTFDEPALTTFGPHDIVLTQGARASAYAIALPTHAVLIAEQPKALSVSVLCPPGSSTSATSTSSQRLLAYVPTDGSCALWLTRPTTSKGASFSLPVWIAQAAAAGGG